MSAPSDTVSQCDCLIYGFHGYVCVVRGACVAWAAAISTSAVILVLLTIWFIQCTITQVYLAECEQEEKSRRAVLLAMSRGQPAPGKVVRTQLGNYFTEIPDEAGGREPRYPPSETPPSEDRNQLSIPMEEGTKLQ